MTSQDPAQLPANPLAWCARVVELIETQTGAFERLARLDGTAGADSSKTDPRAVLSVIDARTPIIAQIVEIDDQLTALKPMWDRHMRRLAPDDRDRIHGAIAALDAVSQRVARADRLTQQQLEQQRDTIADQLLSLSRGQSAAGAYAGSGPAAPRFQDREA